jgi:hypothetical protein
MGLMDRLRQAKCAVGVHSGQWQQVAVGACDEQRTCANCGEVSRRVDHHLSDWAYSSNPAAPPCTQERRCQRCPQAQQEVKHTIEFTYDYPGYHEPCRMRAECTRCRFTDGTTLLAHKWDRGSEPGYVGSDPAPKKVYTCKLCGKQVLRGATAFPPSADARN